jgi:Zn-dependent protease
VLYALRFPFSLAVLVAAFLVGAVARGLVQERILGVRRPALRSPGRPRLGSGAWGIRRFIDPYGALCAVLGGVGWGSDAVDDVIPMVRGGRRSRVVAALIAGPVVLFVLGAAALIGYDHLTTGRPTGGGLVINTVHGDMLAVDHFHYLVGYGPLALYLAGVELVAMALLALVPLPPLDGGRLLFALAPKTLGWQRARYRLEDDNWGLLIVLVLTLPIFGNPIIVAVIDAIIDPLITVLS